MRSDSWQVERAFVPATLDEAFGLRRALIDAGASRATAAGLVDWLLEKALDGTDSTSPDVRSRYRKILRSLNGRYPGTPSNAPLAA